MGIYIRLLAHPSFFHRSKINKCCAYHHENTLVIIPGLTGRLDLCGRHLCALSTVYGRFCCTPSNAAVVQGISPFLLCKHFNYLQKQNHYAYHLLHHLSCIINTKVSLFGIALHSSASPLGQQCGTADERITYTY